MKFSIIVVSLNAGEKLNQTLDSVLAQTYEDYEIIVKDGVSKDGSLEKMRQDKHIRFFSEEDSGIYDAMNQAVIYATGDYVLFLNCGDTLRDEKVLERVAAQIAERTAGEEDESEDNESAEDAGLEREKMVFYGDTYGSKNDVLIAAPPVIDGFACYRNIPCHQSCFYALPLLLEKPFDLNYRIRADYDHFLWCYYEAKAKMTRMDMTVAAYEGGGYSESRENRERDRAEHREITEKYMSPGELRRYRAAMALTLAPLRRAMAESKVFSGVYHWLKECVYRRKIWFLAALIFFVAEMLFMFLPNGWARGELEYFLRGDEFFLEPMTEESSGFCQEFTPRFSKLMSIGVFFSGEPEEIGDGSVIVVVSDSQNEVLFEKTLSYQDILLRKYTELDVRLSLKKGKMYYLSINGTAAAGESPPAVGLCSTAEPLRENQSLVYTDEIPGAQLMTLYRYTDAVEGGKIFKIVLLGLLTAFGIAFGLPKNGRLRSLVALGLLAAGPYLLGTRLELLTINVQDLLPFAMKWNVTILFLFELVVLLVTHSKRFTIVFINLAMTLVYSVNYFVYEYRGVPVRIYDVVAVRTAMDVADKFSFRPNPHMAMAWSMAAVFVVFGFSVGRVKKSRFSWKKAVSYLATICVAIGILAVMRSRLLYSDMIEKAGFMNAHGADQYITYQFNGFLVGTCVDIQNSRIEPPEDYSVKAVEDILGENIAETAPNDDMPNVILIMNESWSDLRILGDLQLSEENMAFVDSMKENTIRGYVNASVLGGGTANSEFEALTGCTMAFLPPSYYPYQQCVVKPMNSLVTNMKRAGYVTYSMHPESEKNWNRKQVYEYLGFEHSFWKDDFKGAQVIHSGVSDQETYYRVEELFRERQAGEKMFIFDLTMQNHGGYAGSDIEKTVRSLAFPSDEADTYLTLIQESDRAFEQLIQYFSREDEKVLICMFGDHQPSFADSSFKKAVLKQMEDISKRERVLRQYKTPFVIWANYDIPERDGLDIGMSYLGAYLLEVAEIPATPYFHFLAEYMQRYPIVTVNGYMDSEGNFKSWKGNDQELAEYRMLQYNYLFDHNNVVEWGY